MGMDSLFKTLIDNIMLTEKQKEDARKKYDGVCETLHNSYYEGTTYNGSTKLLIGSYGKSTNIRPPRDVDVIFKMPEEEFKRFDELEGNKQSQLLQEIRSVIKDTYTTTETIRSFGKVVVIEFADGTHNVELLPAWELADGKFRIPNTENGGSWETYDPVAEIKYVSSSNVKTGKTLDIIRITKKWAENCNVPLESFEIELLVVEFLTSQSDVALEEGYSNLVTGFFKFLVGKANAYIYTPAGKIISLGEDWKSRAESAYQRATKAVEYEEADKFERSSEEWKKVFGDDFPKGEDPKTEEKNLIEMSSKSDRITLLASQFPSHKEEFLDRHYGIRFGLNPSYEVRIDAEVTQAGFRPAWLSSFLEKHYPLKKRKRLAFSIQKNTVPQPYEVMWKVRNFGDEAKGSDDLRGEISHDLGYERKVENTKYYGEHYVECYIIKDRVCVGMDRIRVPIGNSYD